MEYRSTRENATALFASQAIIKGISKDGGLFVPSRFPDLRDSLEKFKELDYKQLAAEVMGAYLDEFDKIFCKKYGFIFSFGLIIILPVPQSKPLS